MTRLFAYGLLIFSLLLLVTSALVKVYNIELGTTNYFDKHGILFLFGLTLFPRLTLLFSSVASSGALWWLTWALTPRLLVASLATIAYFKTNPVLVVISWFIAISGEIFEKTLPRQKKFYFKRFKKNNQHRNLKTNDTIEADYKIIDGD